MLPPADQTWICHRYPPPQLCYHPNELGNGTECPFYSVFLKKMLKNHSFLPGKQL